MTAVVKYIIPKYYLSKKACAGILRRAKKRGKELPPALKAALESVANPASRIGRHTGDDPRAGIGIGEDGDPMFTPQSGKQHAVGVADTLRSHPRPGSNSVGALAFSCKDSGTDAGELAPTLRSMGHDGSHANGGGQIAVAFNLRGREGGAMPETTDVASLRSASGGSSRSYVAQFDALASRNASVRSQGSVMAVRRLTPL